MRRLALIGTALLMAAAPRDYDKERALRAEQDQAQALQDMRPERVKQLEARVAELEGQLAELKRRCGR